MSEMVERVAKFIESYLQDLWSPDDSRDVARSIIAAMREPTEAMRRQWAGQRVPTLGCAAAPEYWQSGIDAALKDG